MRGIQKIGGLEICTALLEKAIRSLHRIDAEARGRNRAGLQQIEHNFTVELCRRRQGARRDFLQSRNCAPVTGKITHAFGSGVGAKFRFQRRIRSLVEA